MSGYSYNPSSHSPFRISRTKINLFVECPRCFYLDVKLGVKRPSIPAFTLNSAVDALLKKEFDLLRKKGQTHKLMKQYNIDAVPYNHPEIDVWRNNFIGKEYYHEETNFILFGAIDDIWINSKNELIIVDYKSTSTEKGIDMNDHWKKVFKRQLEIYQWIYKMSGFKIHDTAYIVYANAGKNKPIFDGMLEFEMTIHPHKGDISWIEPTIFDIKKTLDLRILPDPSPSCEHCRYVIKAGKQ